MIFVRKFATLAHINFVIFCHFQSLCQDGILLPLGIQIWCRCYKTFFLRQNRLERFYTAIFVVYSMSGKAVSMVKELTK